jgi:hypothetical protein
LVIYNNSKKVEPTDLLQSQGVFSNPTSNHHQFLIFIFGKNKKLTTGDQKFPYQ